MSIDAYGSHIDITDTGLVATAKDGRVWRIALTGDAKNGVVNIPFGTIGKAEVKPVRAGGMVNGSITLHHADTKTILHFRKKQADGVGVIEAALREAGVNLA